MRKNKSLFLLAAAIGLLQGCAHTKVNTPASIAQAPQEKSELQDYSFVQLLPINWTMPQGQKINLSVHTPNNFYCFHAPLIMKGIQPSLIEYLPKGENIESWSELITLVPLIGSKLDAKTLSDTIKQNFQRISSHLKILEETTSSEEGYNTATLILSYSYKGRSEVVVSRVFSGPFDTVNVQYAAVLKNEQNPQHLAQRLKNWMNNKENVQIIKF